MDNKDVKVMQLQLKVIESINNSITLKCRLNAALRCLVKIRNTYPHIYNECLSEEDILSITEGRNKHGRSKETDS